MTSFTGSAGLVLTPLRRGKAMKKRRMVLDAWNGYVIKLVPLRQAA
jgi:hypothetical protein